LASNRQQSSMSESGSAILLITCPDRKGIVAAISTFLSSHGANILHNDQHQENVLGLFFTRVEWDLRDFDLDETAFGREFTQVATDFGMTWRLEYSSPRARVGILVSRETHCLLALLYRRQSNEIQCDVPLIISNHSVARDLAAFYEIPYHEVAV